MVNDQNNFHAPVNTPGATLAIELDLLQALL